jgi:GDP-fucose transporter C1
MAAAVSAPGSATLLRERQMTIVSVVSAYFVVSIALVFVNKILLSSEVSMPAPVFVTWYQCVVTVGICWLCGHLGSTAAPGSFFKQFPQFTYRWDVAVKLLPLSLVFVGMITFNNLCLKYVEVSFYNVARSLTIVFNVVFTYFMLGEKTSIATVMCLGIVVMGFLAGSEGEVNFSMVGTVFGVASSVFVSLNSIYTKKAMPLVDGNQWTLAAYNNMNACLMFLPIIVLTGEPSAILGRADLLASATFWGIMTVGGIFGFLIGIVTILQIKVTSPLTHNISGTAKACVQTVLALLWWKNPTTVTNLMGVALVLAGSMAYSYVRTQEMAVEAAAKKAKAGSVPAEAAVEDGADLKGGREAGHGNVGGGGKGSQLEKGLA